MNDIQTQTTIGQLVAERPSRARVFETLGLDYCCGGKVALDKACAERGLDLDSVVTRLEESDAGRAAETERDLRNAPLAELADHIVEVHHGFLRQELPRLSMLSAKVAQAHGQRFPALVEVQGVFEDMRAELESHTMKEEGVLFPLCKQLETSTALPDTHFGSVANPIRVMEHEHDSAGAALARLNKLTDAYSTPSGVCNTYRALMDGLAELERDLHQHIHKENNILFPRALAVEDDLARRTGAPA
ncbi:MAG: iron-sulfur cluster repair di-iron protein [Chthonomonadales bacterium]|nr:iron-sulfur cluster repair di-iron protein [Chthonomonadales bacterium]